MDHPMRRLKLHDGPPTEDEKAFDEALEEMNKNVEKAKVPEDTETTKYCRCACHYTGGMMHFKACCNGRCSKCGFYIKSNRKQHEEGCTPNG